MRLYDYPLASEFEAFLAEVKQRMDSIIDEIDGIKELIAVRNAEVAVKLKEMYARISSLRSSSVDYDGLRSGFLTVIREPFVDTSSMDYDAIAGEPAEIVSHIGALSLRRLSSTELSISSVRIAGNGLPGNSHVVYEESGLYHAKDGLHADPKYMVDGKSDTWFEYERLFGLQGYKYRNTSFSEGLYWLSFDQEPLVLDIEMELEAPEIVSGMIVNPFIPAAPWYRPPYLVSATLDDCKGLRQSLQGGRLSDKIMVPCLPQYAKKVRMRIKQAYPYSVAIGLPDKVYSVSKLGMRYDPATGDIRPPEYIKGEESLDEQAVIDELFLQPAAEILPALRYSIGIRDISLFANTYAEESEYVSKPYHIDGGIKSLSVDVEYIIPEALKRDGLAEVGISFDDGATWHRIAGNDEEAAVFGLARKIVLSGYTPDFLMDKSAIYIPKTADSFRVRIKLRRPDIEHGEYVSPIVTGYTVVVEEARDAEGRDALL
jgi:hypothetical protein